MIQFNLLPDVKIEFIRTRYRKRMIIMIASAASAVCVLIFIILFLFVRVNQPRHMSDLDRDIKDTVSEIKQIPDIDKILTIQNQLNSLPDLHDKKVISSRLVDYLTKLTPNDATISDVNVDFQANTISIRGNANDLVTVNKFIDTIKFTEFKVNADGGASGKAFSNVVMQSFSVASDSDDEASYEIAMTFDPAIFAQFKDIEDGKEQVTLTVPSITSTRSATELPTGAGLFEPQPTQEEGGN
jgi:Tfp pilus assembly protein PilN